MAKFDEEAWRRRNEREQEEEEARKFLEYQGSDDELRTELAEMLGVDFETLRKAARASLSPEDLKKLDETKRKAQKALREKNTAKAEKIVMSTRGMREVRKLKKKKDGGGCAVIALLVLTVSASTSAAIIWGAVEVIAAVLP